jgi:hypothetical protein
MIRKLMLILLGYGFQAYGMLVAIYSRLRLSLGCATLVSTLANGGSLPNDKLLTVLTPSLLRTQQSLPFKLPRICIYTPYTRSNQYSSFASLQFLSD